MWKLIYISRRRPWTSIGQHLLCLKTFWIRSMRHILQLGQKEKKDSTFYSSAWTSHRASASSNLETSSRIRRWRRRRRKRGWRRRCSPPNSCSSLSEATKLRLKKAQKLKIGEAAKRKEHRELNLFVLKQNRVETIPFIENDVNYLLSSWFRHASPGRS